MFSAAGVSPQYQFLYSINLAGAEFGAPPWRGTYGVNYYFPLQNEWDYVQSRRFNCVRLPVRWERCQPTLGGALDATYMGRIDDAIDFAKARSIKVILDIHNYGGYYQDGDAVNEYMIGGGTTTEAHFVDLWDKLSLRYANEQNDVIFGLMNEPRGVGEGISTETWFSAANAATVAIRANGWKGLILVAGNGYSGVDGWNENWYGTSNQTAALNYVDSANNYAFEGHTYWDADGSGDYGLWDGSEAPYGDVFTTTKGTDVLQTWITWLRTNKKKGFIGEWGVPNTARAKVSVEDWMALVWENRDVIIGICYWAAGPWWGLYDADHITCQPTGSGPWTDDARMDFWRQNYLPQPQLAKNSWTPAIDIENLNAYYRCDYQVGSWVSHALTSGFTLNTASSTSPAQGSTVNSKVPADFNGTTHGIYASGKNMSHHGSASAYSGWALVYVDAISTDEATFTDNDAIMADTGSTFGIFLKGTNVVLMGNDGAQKSVSAAITTGGWRLVQWTFDGVDMRLRVNNGAWQSASCGALSLSATSLRYGVNPAASQRFDGKIMEIGHASSVISDDYFNNLRTYSNSKYNTSV
jgi:endoglucanase